MRARTSPATLPTKANKKHAAAPQNTCPSRQCRTAPTVAKRKTRYKMNPNDATAAPALHPQSCAAALSRVSMFTLSGADSSGRCSTTFRIFRVPKKKRPFFARASTSATVRSTVSELDKRSRDSMDCEIVSCDPWCTDLPRLLSGNFRSHSIFDRCAKPYASHPLLSRQRRSCAPQVFNKYQHGIGSGTRADDLSRRVLISGVVDHCFYWIIGGESRPTIDSNPPHLCTCSRCKAAHAIERIILSGTHEKGATSATKARGLDRASLENWRVLMVGQDRYFHTGPFGVRVFARLPRICPRQ